MNCEIGRTLLNKENRWTAAIIVAQSKVLVVLTDTTEPAKSLYLNFRYR